MAFNPQAHMTKLGNREYLEVKWRIVWYRESYPKGQIRTTFFHVGDMLIAQTDVSDNEGVHLASGSATVRAGTGRETWTGREIEKAETAAIGRALAHAGFGTQFTDEDEGHNLADAPVERKQAPKQQSKPAAAPQATKDSEGLLYTGDVRVVDVRKDKNNKPYVVANNISFFSRDPFREIGFPDEFIEKLAVVKNEVYLPDAIRIAYIEEQKDGKVYRTPKKVHRISTNQTVLVK